MAFSGTQITRLGLSGTSRQLYAFQKAAVGIVQVLNELLDIQESNDTTKGISVQISENLNIPETTVDVLALLIVQIINETQNISETTVNILLVTITQVIDEMVNIGESQIDTKAISISLAEIVNTSETTETAMVRVRVLFEQLDIPENNQKAMILLRAISETISFVESIARQIGLRIAMAIKSVIKLYSNIGGNTVTKAAIDADTTTKEAAQTGKTKVRPIDQ